VAVPIALERIWMHLRSYVLINVGGWLFFGAAVTIGSLEQYAWPIVLVITRSTVTHDIVLFNGLK
jgi:hypothetical protein